MDGSADGTQENGYGGSRFVGRHLVGGQTDGVADTHR